MKLRFCSCHSHCSKFSQKAKKQIFQRRIKKKEKVGYFSFCFDGILEKEEDEFVEAKKGKFLPLYRSKIANKISTTHKARSDQISPNLQDDFFFNYKASNGKVQYKN